MDSTQGRIDQEFYDAAHTHARTQKRLQDAALDKVFYDRHRGVLQDRTNASGLVETIEALSAKAGLPAPPRLYLTPHYPSFYAGPNAAGGGLPGGMGGFVVLNEPLLKAFHYTPGTLPPPEPLQAVIAHELSHVKDGFTHAMNTRILPLLGMPALAVGALYLYDKTLNRMQRAGKQAHNKDELSLALESASSEMLDELGVPGNVTPPAVQEQDGSYTFTPDETVKRNFVDRARYLVAAAAGLGAGLMTTRHYSIAGEFRADRMAVKLMGGRPEPMIEGLSTIYRESRRPFVEYMRSQPPKSDLQKASEKLWKAIDMEFINAYPSLRERIHAMREYAASLSRQGGHLL